MLLDFLCLSGKKPYCAKIRKLYIYANLIFVDKFYVLRFCPFYAKPKFQLIAYFAQDFDKIGPTLVLLIALTPSLNLTTIMKLSKSQ